MDDGFDSKPTGGPLLSKAMSKAFAQIEGAIKGKANPAFRSKYADLSSVVDAIKPALAEHGLWFRQVTHYRDGCVGIETVIHHECGALLSCGTLYLPVTRADAQGYGSALTYARRYSLMTAFGVPAEDDDGNAATGRAPATERPASTDTDPMLDSLRAAALDGPQALQAAFAALPAGPAKAAVWRTHGESLKAAAAQAVPA